MNAAEFDASLWHYRARYIRAIDGDTLLCLVELPFGLRYEMRVRLAGFSAPERNTLEGQLAAQRMRELFAGDRYTGAMLETRYWPLRIVTEKRPSGDETTSFERYVARVYLCSEDHELTDLVGLLS
ncbi:MAG: hypothetical protein H0U59_06080 [Gemmatimonadaceae bacterium]|nr:hypothetical protein [Gemmatimonadaceae bacterium]